MAAAFTSHWPPTGGRGTNSLRSAIEGVDALVTAEPGVVLTMMVADCVPIALYSPQAQVAAAVHSGWRGTVVRVAKAAVEAMAELGARPTTSSPPLVPPSPPTATRWGRR